MRYFSTGIGIQWAYFCSENRKKRNTEAQGCFKTIWGMDGWMDEILCN